MEKLEIDDTIPHAVLAHQKQVAVEKATEQIIRAEQKEPLCDRIASLFDGVEPWQNYPINTFR